MAIERNREGSEGRLDQVAGITGVGWTASLLGYLSSILGFNTALGSNPQSLLYLGAVLFVTTLGLDRLRKNRAAEES